MRSQQAIYSFAGGVRSPRLSVRADSNPNIDRRDAFHQSLSTGTNWLISSQGSLIKRYGLKYLLPTLNSAKARIFQFHRGGDKSDLILEATANNLRFWQDESLMQDVGGDIVKTTPYTEADLEQLQFTNQETIGVFLHPNHPPLYIEIREDDTIEDPIFLEFSRLPFFNYNDLNSPNFGAAAATWRVVFPNEWVGGDYSYFIRYNGQFSENGTGAPFAWGYKPLATQNQNDIEAALADIFTLLGLPTTATATVDPNNDHAYDVELSGDGSGFALDFIKFEPEAPGFITSTPVIGDGSPLEPAWTYPLFVEHDGSGGWKYYQNKQAHTSGASTEPDVGIDWTDYWEDLGTTKPIGFDWQHGDGAIGTNNAWVTGTFYAKWDRGFPTVPIFHEQRLILMSNKDALSGIWGSRISKYQDFVIGTNADDPFSFELDTSDTPAIRWATSQQQLLLGTSSGDWNISALVSLAPTDIQAVKQNYARSHKNPPAVIDHFAFYIEQGKTKIRQTTYVEGVQGFKSVDVSLVAENLLRDEVTRLVTLRTPEILIATPRLDGNITVMMFTEWGGSLNYAFTQFTFEDTIHDCASAFRVYPDTFIDADQLYCVVERAGAYSIERMNYPEKRLENFFEQLTENDLVLLDSYVTGDLVTLDNNRIDGLDHLEGKTVAILVNDAWIEGEHIVADGAVSFSTDPDEVLEGKYAVGINYTSTAKTFQRAVGNAKGSALGTRRRWNRIIVTTLDSAIVKVNGLKPADRRPATVMDTAETIRLGVEEIEMANVGWDDGSIELIQDRPYPTQLLGLYGEIDVSNA